MCSVVETWWCGAVEIEQVELWSCGGPLSYLDESLEQFCDLGSVEDYSLLAVSPAHSHPTVRQLQYSCSQTVTIRQLQSDSYSTVTVKQLQ